MRQKYTMIGWFQFKHGDGLVDSWILDNVNITASKNIVTSGDSESNHNVSWIYGVIAGLVIVMIMIVTIIIVK